MTIEIGLADDAKHVMVNIRGVWHACTDDECDCQARSFGNLCSHLRLLHALGGFDDVARRCRAENRKRKKEANV